VKADLTRKSFDPLKHFSRVLMQQGRVQLDADWNEQAAILLHMVRSLAAYAFPSGGGNGFAVAPLDAKPIVQGDFALGPGSYWVGGILCELESTPVSVTALNADQKQITVAGWTVDEIPFQIGQYVLLTGDTSASTPPATTTLTAKITALDYSNTTLTLDTDFPAKLKSAKNVRVQRLVTYKSQPDLPQPPPLANGSYQIYLDVWERLITYVEDDSIREVALNGPDTAARTRVVWQVGALAYQPPAEQQPGNLVGNTGAANNQCLTIPALQSMLGPANVGRLRARSQPGEVSTDPCTIAPDSSYRGPENQLYRVEVHNGNSTDATRQVTFKWSRENGAVVFPLVSIASVNGVPKITLANLGRDDRFSLHTGDFVEIQDDRSVLSNAVGQLLQVQSIDAGSMTVLLSGTLSGSVGSDPTLHPLVRRWDQVAGDPTQGGFQLAAGAAILVADAWLNLEDGVQVQFPGAAAATFRTGDYWLIPARVATGDVVWPQESGLDAQGNTVINPVARLPDGVMHFYAPLAIVAVADGKAPVVTPCQAPRLGGG
jgi:hypothetical protein